MSKTIFAQNLVYLLDQNSLTSSDLANKLPTSKQNVSNWTNAKAYPKHEQLTDLCNLLNFYDIYKMMNVNLQRQHIRPKKEETVCPKFHRQLLTQAQTLAALLNNTIAA